MTASHRIRADFPPIAFVHFDYSAQPTTALVWESPGDAQLADCQQRQCAEKDRAAAVRLNAKLSNLAEFCGTILVSMAMNTSRYREAAEPSRTPERRYKVKRKRILVVEDDALSLVVLRQLLTAQGYEILQSSEGWDGINRARNEQPDLIVMDIKLPDISGLDAALLLKKDNRTKNIPIIAVTACITPEDKANALKSGCDAYIAKPVNMANFLRTVELFLPSSQQQSVCNERGPLAR